MELHQIIEKESLSKDDIITLLSLKNQKDITILRNSACQIMSEKCGTNVYYRGLIEFSNVCVNDCYYCGIRKSNHGVERFTLTRDQIVDAACWCAKEGYGSVVLQSGDRNDPKFIGFVEDVLKEIKKRTVSERQPQGIGITLCVGEQSSETYQRFFNAGAHRYLLRIESTNPELFHSIHPKNQTLERRIQCIKKLQEIGYQVGTGVMIGLPEQSIEDLACDILFFKENNIDMIGMGPYIVHQQTPMNCYTDEIRQKQADIFQLALRMIAVTRLVLKDVNIAATTALQAVDPTGREQGLQFGANVVMPQLTPGDVRRQYTLYDGKPCLDEVAEDCKHCLEKRIRSIGRKVAFYEWGDPRHFFNRQWDFKKHCC